MGAGRYLLEVLIILGVPAGVVYLGGRAVLRGWRARAARALRSAPWRPNVRSLGNDCIVVEVARPGETSQVVAELDTGDGDFEALLMDAEVRAENTARALNFALRESKKIRA